MEALYLDAIAAARHAIHLVEAQYFTSAEIGDALVTRLAEANGPEIVLVLPRKASGWLEQNTMDVLRARLLRRLCAAYQFGRLRVYCPVMPGLEKACINVHSKVLIVDETLVRAGSSNISNRSTNASGSMGVVRSVVSHVYLATSMRNSSASRRLEPISWV